MNNMHIAILGTMFNAKPRLLSVSEIFWALPSGDHALLLDYLTAMADLDVEKCITMDEGGDLPVITAKGIALLTDSNCVQVQLTREVCHAGGTGAVANRKPPTSSDCAQEHRGDTALDAMAGRVQAVNRGIAADWITVFSYICEDCGNTFSASGPLVVCNLCANRQILCPECHEFHMEAGHVTDAVNAASGKV